MKIKMGKLVNEYIQDTREEVLDELIKENVTLFDHHLQEMTKYEQRMNVLLSHKNEKTPGASLN